MPANRTIQLAPEVELDVDRLVTSRALLTASSGAGKSQSLRWLLERTHGLVQQIVIDPEGEFRTLRELPDSDYLIAAAPGDETEVIAHPKTAKVLARKILEVEISTVIDLSDLRPHERDEFLKVFLNALVHSSRKHWKVPRLVVIDEAHKFAPEKGKAESTAAVIDLMAMGRKRNLCGVLATQRLSKLHADARGECGTVFIGRTYQDIDLRRVCDILGRTKAAWPEIRDLDDGEFLAFGAALTKGIHQFRFERCRTTHPKAGSGVVPTPPPSGKVKKALAGLGDLLTESETEARTLAEVRKELAQARRQITLLKKAQPEPEVKIETVELLPAELRDRLVDFFGQLGGLREPAATMATLLDDVEATMAGLRDEVESMNVSATNAVARAKRRGMPTSVRRAGLSRRAPTGPDGGLTGPEQRILNALAWWEQIGVDEPTKQSAGHIAGYRVGKRVGGHYGNLLGGLRSKGLVDYPNAGTIALTDEGRAVAVPPDIAPTTEALQAEIFSKLTAPEQRILQALVDAYPESMTKQDVGAEAGYQVGDRVGGHFGNLLGGLRSLGLIDYPRPGDAVATDLLFVD